MILHVYTNICYQQTRMFSVKSIHCLGKSKGQIPRSFSSLIGSSSSTSLFVSTACNIPSNMAIFPAFATSKCSGGTHPSVAQLSQLDKSRFRFWAASKYRYCFRCRAISPDGGKGNGHESANPRIVQSLWVSISSCRKPTAPSFHVR